MNDLYQYYALGRKESNGFNKESDSEGIEAIDFEKTTTYLEGGDQVTPEFGFRTHATSAVILYDNTLYGDSSETSISFSSRTDVEVLDGKYVLKK